MLCNRSRGCSSTFMVFFEGGGEFASLHMTSKYYLVFFRYFFTLNVILSFQFLKLFEAS